MKKDELVGLRVRDGKLIIATGAGLDRYPAPTEEQIREARTRLVEKQ